ncbi:hypothetical protein [Azonexus sp.]|uniref:hypothetical protein n=1 Tax=Azonexus sp. TaxID=1872668 RepID=UPI0027B8D47F|nr:hypothetical protein [Azonexus sp.]
MSYRIRLAIKMRWIWVATVVALSAVNTHAADALFNDSLSASVAAANSSPGDSVPDSSTSVIDGSVPASGVTIAVIPAPAPVLELQKLEDPIATISKGKKLKLTKKKTASKVLLTRTERRRVELLGDAPKIGDQQGPSYSHNEDYQVSFDKQDLHRSYSFPKLVSDTFDLKDDGSDAENLSSTVRVRLLMARLKALEAQALAQAPDNDEDLSETVLLRLKEARLKAVLAHQNKYT